MSSEEPCYTLEELETWKVEALKLFCRKRGLKVSGRRNELEARVFAASEMGILIAPTAEELVKKTELEKAKLLMVSAGIKLPDPNSLETGWLDETNGIESWPPIYLSDITIYIMKDHPGKDVDLHKRVLNEYKEGKAFRLFDSGFLKEVYYHEISGDSDYCFLRSKCTHTMSISSIPLIAWVAALKSTGEIFNAYCTCVAGMSGSCIHVTALLFRIEAANRTGMTNPACTSKQCIWNKPADKTVIKPAKMIDMDWKAAKLNKEPKRSALDPHRTLFEPAVKVCRSDNEKRELFFNGFKDILPDSCIVLMKTAEHEQEIMTPVTHNNKASQLTDDQIEDIERNTVGQSENETWHKYRKGRITASNFYRVYTKVETIKSHGDSGGTADKLVKHLCDSEGPQKDLPSLKYGREMEGRAKQVYLKHFQENHRDASIGDCGLFIHNSKQYLGASPDALVECSCCGKGVLEIKCPSSIIDKTPLPENLPYLISQDEKVVLKENHMYFAQIQGQLAITKRHWCHFYVYSQAGYHLETIQFDESYWNKLEANLSWFYTNYMSQKTS